MSVRSGIAQAISGVAVLGAVAGMVMLPDPAATPVGHQAQPVAATDQQASLVCLGGVKRAVQEGITVDEVAEDITGWAGIYAQDPGAASAAQKLLSESADTAQGTAQAIGILPVSGLAAGSTVHSAAGGDLRSLAVSPCVWPQADIWLVGGQSTLGSSLRMVLVNPGRTPTVVNIEAFSGRGPVDLGQKSTITLAPEGETEVILDGVIPAEERLAFHLYSESGKIGALMQSTQLDGAKPAGVDFINSSSFGTNLVIPGLVVSDDADSGRLRIVNPGSDAATVSVKLISEQGTQELAGAQNVKVAAGTVLELSLTGLAADTYAVQVTADQEVAAGVAHVRAEEAGTDVAWLAGAPKVKNAMAAIGNETGTLALVAPDADPVAAEVVTYGEDGAELSRQNLQGGRLSQIALPAEATYVQITAQNPVYAGASLRSANGVAWLALTEDATENLSYRLRVLD